MHALFLPHWNRIAWVFTSRRSDSANCTVFANCFWGVVRLTLTAAAVHINGVRLWCGVGNAQESLNPATQSVNRGWMWFNLIQKNTATKHYAHLKKNVNTFSSFLYFILNTNTFTACRESDVNGVDVSWCIGITWLRHLTGFIFSWWPVIVYSF